MNRFLPYLTLFFLLIFSSQTYAVESVIAPSDPIEKDCIAKPNNQIPSKKDWEAKLGRKLNFKERISLRLLQNKLKNKKQGKEPVDRFALWGMIIGILGAVLLYFLTFIAFIAGVVAIILSAKGIRKTKGLKVFRKRDRDMAITGLILGILIVALVLGTGVYLGLFGFQ